MTSLPLVYQVMTERELDERIRRLIADLGLQPLPHARLAQRQLAGFPDLVVAGPAGLIFAECKSMSGQGRPDQEQWRDVLLTAGATWFLWRPANLADRMIARQLTQISLSEAERDQRRRPRPARSQLHRVTPSGHLTFPPSPDPGPQSRLIWPEHGTAEDLVPAPPPAPRTTMRIPTARHGRTRRHPRLHRPMCSSGSSTATWRIHSIISRQVRHRRRPEHTSLAHSKDPPPPTRAASPAPPPHVTLQPAVPVP